MSQKTLHAETYDFCFTAFCRDTSKGKFTKITTRANNSSVCSTTKNTNAEPGNARHEKKRGVICVELPEIDVSTFNHVQVLLLLFSKPFRTF